VGADDHTLHHIKEAAHDWYDVLHTIDPEHSIKLLESHPDVSVFIAEHNPDEFDSVVLLDRVRADHPGVRRVVMTSHLDLSRIMHGLYNGAIQRLVQKPIHGPALHRAIFPYTLAETEAPTRLAG
jgi:DNA-binding NtrC family response regulator